MSLLTEYLSRSIMSSSPSALAFMVERAYFSSTARSKSESRKSMREAPPATDLLLSPPLPQDAHHQRRFSEAAEGGPASRTRPRPFGGEKSIATKRSSHSAIAAVDLRNRQPVLRDELIHRVLFSCCQRTSLAREVRPHLGRRPSTGEWHHIRSET